MNRRIRKFKPAPQIRCDIWESYGCPSPGGDEFAAPVDVRCHGAASHRVKGVDWGFPWSMKVCGYHARSIKLDDCKVYRFRTV